MFHKKSGFLHNAKHRHGPFSLTMLCNIDKFRGGFFFFSWNGIYFRCQFFNLLHIAHFAKHSALWDHWLWIGLYLILKRFFFFENQLHACANYDSFRLSVVLSDFFFGVQIYRSKNLVHFSAQFRFRFELNSNRTL